jgi:hypothetical protein
MVGSEAPQGKPRGNEDLCRFFAKVFTIASCAANESFF